jgi:gluconate 2-dehydrogenase gamma chain
MVNRREFMAAGALAGAALAASTTACRRSGYGVLTESQAATLAALCDQIIPADDYPSASQAGVVVYIDRQLMGPYRRHRRAYADGLNQVNLLANARFGVGLATASPQQQFEVVTALEAGNKLFFDLVRNHTMQGYYGSPRHGGNRDAISWRMLSLDEPPVRGRAQYDFTRSGTTGGSKS